MGCLYLRVLFFQKNLYLPPEKGGFYLTGAALRKVSPTQTTTIV